jgi:hypothetical protein
MILGTSYDFKGIENYQFYDDKIYTNCLVNLGFSTDLELDISTSHGMKKTDHNLKITKLSKNGHIIHKINGKPAVRELHKIQNWPDDFLDENTMLHKILYYPISPTWHGQERPTVLPYILKDSIMTSCLIEEGDASVLTVNGKNIINAIDTNLDHFLNIEPTFGLCSSCMTIIQAIGNKAELIREEMIKYFNEKPFIMFYCAGEGTYSPETDINYANMSFNTAVFGKKANKNQEKQAETNLNKLIDNSL